MNIKEEFIKFADRQWGKSRDGLCQTERFKSYYEVWCIAIATSLVHDLDDVPTTTPVMKDGKVKNFMIKGFRCNCGCNVFHKPDDKNLNFYQCNGCETTYLGEIDA